MIYLKIEKIVVMENRITNDLIILFTDLPDDITGNVCLELKVRSGVEFVRKHFNIDPEIIKADGDGFLKIGEKK